MSRNLLSGRAILIVEDNYFLATDLQRNLELAGARVLGPVGSISEAFQLIRDERVDAALLDIELEEETSYPIAERLAAIGVPFLFVSNAVDIPSEYRGRCFDKSTGIKQIAQALFPDAG